MLKKANELFCSFRNCDIVYCHWKSNEHLAAGLDGETDLDVLMAPKDKKKATAQLWVCGYEKVRPQFGARYPEVEDWVSMDEETGKLLHVHLHYRMITGHKGMKEYGLPWAELALNTRVLDEARNIFITEPNLEIILLLARIGLKMKLASYMRCKLNRYVISEDDQREIRYLQKRIDANQVKNIAMDYFYNPNEIGRLATADRLDAQWVRAVHGAMWKDLQKYRDMPLLPFFFRSIFFRVGMSVTSRFKKYLPLMDITKKTLEQRGLIVAIIGQDGAGKSTVSADCVKWLRWKLEAERCYLGSGGHYHSVEKTIRKKIGKSRHIISRLLYGYLTVRDNLKLSKRTVKTLFRADTYRRKGAIAIFDRYPQIDYAGINDGPKIRAYVERFSVPILFRRYFNHLADREEANLKKALEIQPDVVIKLTLTPEESIRRKPEESLDTVRKKREIIQKLSFPCSKVFTVDAAQPYERELLEIRRIIWGAIREAGQKSWVEERFAKSDEK